MSVYESYLQHIAGLITINDADRQVYTKDFDIIRDHVLGAMCRVDRVFKWIYKGPSLFGSYANNVRINKPDEFDVIFKLCIPFVSLLDVQPDDDRPGFVNLDFEDVMPALLGVHGYEDVYNRFDDLVDSNNDYLRRSNLQNWLEELIERGLYEFGNTIRGCCGDSYRLQYSKRGLAHTIFACCKNRKISIDFIPAIVFGEREWLDIRTNRPFGSKCDRWYAIPKPINVGPWKTKKYAFMICNPRAEHELLLSRQNLKVVFRLLKSLRDEYEMPRLKSYFFTTAFLWEIERQKRTFWNNPLYVLLEHMLDVLSDYFVDAYLPFFWAKDLNLLDILSDDEIENYKNKLCKAYNTLSSYKHQPNLSFGRCASHFEIPQ